MRYLEDRGGADDLAKFLSKGHADDHDRMNRVGDNEYEPEGFFGSERLQKYVPPWANEKEGALPAYVVSSLNSANKNLTAHLRQVCSTKPNPRTRPRGRTARVPGPSRSRGA